MRTAAYNMMGKQYVQGAAVHQEMNSGLSFRDVLQVSYCDITDLQQQVKQEEKTWMLGDLL